MTKTELALHQRIENTLNLIFDYGGIEGDHHRAWVIDRVVYTLLGGPDHHEDYLRWVAEWECNGEYHWEKGIIP